MSAEKFFITTALYPRAILVQKQVAELNTMIQNLYADVLPERQVWRMIQYDEEQIKTTTSYV